MSKRFMLFVLLLLVVPLLLAACGGDDDDNGDDDNGDDNEAAEVLSAEDLEAAVQKTFTEGDPSDMNALICEAEQMSQEAADQFVAMNAEWTIDCSVESDSYNCNIGTEGVDIVFSGAIEDDKLCNSTVTMNGQEVPIGGGSS